MEELDWLDSEDVSDELERSDPDSSLALELAPDFTCKFFAVLDAADALEEVLPDESACPDASAAACAEAWAEA